MPFFYFVPLCETILYLLVILRHMEIDKDLYEKLCRYCAYQDRCESEVRSKLYALKVPKAEYPPYINLLKQDKYLDEARYVKAFVAGHVRKKWGKVKIKAALQMKGLKPELIKRFLAEVEDDNYEEKLLEVAQKKARTIKATTPSLARTKLMQYLMGKGYEMDKIKLVLKKLKL